MNLHTRNKNSLVFKKKINSCTSITGPQPWDVVRKNKHHPRCVVLPATLGNVPDMPRYYCRGRSHDNTPVYLAGTAGFLRRVLFQVTQAGDSFGIVFSLGMYAHLYYFICMLLFFIYIYLCS